MFGIYRFLLACMVMCGHTWFYLPAFGKFNWVGIYAVFGFYTLSGYLMTRVLHETYGYRPDALLRFLGNRALRIYPAYWVAMLVMVALLHLDPTMVGTHSTVVHLPNDASEWFHSVVIFGIDAMYSPRLVPASWSLYVELVWYGMLAVGFSRSWRTALLWLVAALVGHLYASAQGVDFALRYGTIAGASLPFAAGSLVYFLPSLGTGAAAGLLVVAAFLAQAILPVRYGLDPLGPCFYASLVIAVLATLALRDVRPTGWLRRVDQQLGDLAYPIFLLHMQVSYFTSWALPAWTAPPERWFAVALLPTVLSAVLFHRLVEKPVEKLRGRVRGVEIGARERRSSGQGAA